MVVRLSSKSRLLRVDLLLSEVLMRNLIEFVSLQIVQLRFWCVHRLALSRNGLAQACEGHTGEELLQLLVGLHKIKSPELIAAILDQLNEGDQKSPGMWPVDDQTLQQHTCDLLADLLDTSVAEEPQDDATEAVSVHVGEAQMVCEGREHPESSLRVEMLQQVLEEDQAW